MLHQLQMYYYTISHYAISKPQSTLINASNTNCVHLTDLPID